MKKEVSRTLIRALGSPIDSFGRDASSGNVTAALTPSRVIAISWRQQAAAGAELKRAPGQECEHFPQHVMTPPVALQRSRLTFRREK